MNSLPYFSLVRLWTGLLGRIRRRSGGNGAWGRGKDGKEWRWADGGGYMGRWRGVDGDGLLLWYVDFFGGRGLEVEDGEAGVADEAGEVVDAGAGAVGAAEDEEGLRAYVDCGEEGAPVLLEVASAKGEGVAVENEGEAEVESATVVGGAGGDEDGLPAGVGECAEPLFGKNPADVGTTTADDAEWVAGLDDGGSPENVVGEGLPDCFDG